jgi:4-hydroxyphenylpyruvate dioxygenase
MPARRGARLVSIDHLTRNVRRGKMDAWAEFYGRVFGFREIRTFGIEGRISGLRRRALVSPCGKIRSLIARKGDEGFGEGNFRARFQSMEAGEGPSL